MSAVVRLGACGCCGNGGCETVFQDNFDDAVPGLNGAPGPLWNVFAHVDVIGQPRVGFAFFDLLPGNGLYLDMVGSTPGVGQGDISTRGLYAFRTGYYYELSYRLAGNQRSPSGGQTLRIRVQGTLDGGGAVTYLDTTETVSGWQQPFEVKLHTIIPAANGMATVRFSQHDTPGVGAEFFGVLLDRVELKRCVL
jgi:hypothetical protein